MKQNYQLQLTGYVGGPDFDKGYIDYTLKENDGKEVNVLIDSLGGQLATAISVASAFNQHGQVSVHYVGMNASAATIASLGAKHISMDASAMYLVHKCTKFFFELADANTDKLEEIINKCLKEKKNLEKMDANVAQMYAARCKRKPEDLLALMKEGGWLTAQEALEWGFVDEVTHFDYDVAPAIDDRIAADMGAAGIPVPTQLLKNASATEGFLAKVVETLTKVFVPTKQKGMEQQKTAEVQSAAVITDTQKQLEAQKAEIESLKAQIEALKKEPGAQTTQVVQAQTTAKESSNNEVEAFIQARNNAQKLYKMLP